MISGRLLNFSEPQIPPLQNGHQNASLGGFLEGSMGQGAPPPPPQQGRHEVAGVRVCIIPAASSEGAPPWIASVRLPGGAPTQTALAGFLGALKGVHSGTQTAPVGFQKLLQVAPREKRDLGKLRRWCASRPPGGSMRPGTAPSGLLGSASPASVCDHNRSVLSGERSPNIHP